MSAPVAVLSTPLQVIFVAGTGYKVGIQAGFSSGVYQLYEFDTGGVGFWSAYDGSGTSKSGWWPRTSNTGIVYQVTYASGNYYQGNPVTLPLYFPCTNLLTQAGTELQSGSLQVAQIFEAQGKWGDTTNWQNDVENGVSPLWSNFYGDFGCAMKVNASYPQLYSILQQLPQNYVYQDNNQVDLANGYVIIIGPYPGPGGAAGSAFAASLQLGLLYQNIDSSWQCIPFQEVDGTPSVVGDLYLTFDGCTEPFTANLAVLLDSGTPSTHIWSGQLIPQSLLEQHAAPDDKKRLADGVGLRLVCNGVTLLDFTCGNETGKNLCVFTPEKAPLSAVPVTIPGRLVTGLQTFFGNQVMFDIKNQQLRIKALSAS